MIDPIEFPETSEPATTSSTFNGVRLSTRIMPAVQAARGGDWCEAFPIAKDVLALSIGDICGHGIEKYDAMVATRQAIRDAAHHGCDPAHTLAKANELLCRADPLEFATAIFALFNTRQRSLVFANAGHPPPLMAGPFGTFFLEFPEPDLSLGIETDFDPAVHAVSIPAETLLVFYTDGVSERERRPVQGTAQLHDATNVAYRSSMSHAAGVIEEQMSLRGANPDDAAILTAWTPALWSAGAALRRDDVAGFHQHTI